jgi:hypothetical protein
MDWCTCQLRHYCAGCGGPIRPQSCSPLTGSRKFFARPLEGSYAQNVAASQYPHVLTGTAHPSALDPAWTACQTGAPSLGAIFRQSVAALIPATSEIAAYPSGTRQCWCHLLLNGDPHPSLLALFVSSLVMPQSKSSVSDVRGSCRCSLVDSDTGSITVAIWIMVGRRVIVR